MDVSEARHEGSGNNEGQEWKKNGARRAGDWDGCREV